MKKQNDLVLFQIMKELRGTSLIDNDGQLTPEALKGSKDMLKIIAMCVAIPALAAALTTLVLALGSGSVLVLWWVLFV